MVRLKIIKQGQSTANALFKAGKLIYFYICMYAYAVLL